MPDNIIRKEACYKDKINFKLEYIKFLWKNKSVTMSDLRLDGNDG